MYKDNGKRLNGTRVKLSREAGRFLWDLTVDKWIGERNFLAFHCISTYALSVTIG